MASPGAQQLPDAHVPSVRLDGGRFLMGSEDPEAHPGDGEGPVREVVVSSFEIDETTVTNAHFSAFVDATGHVTDAERFGWSFVFAPFVASPGAVLEDVVVPGAPWWKAVRGADWRHPHGPGSDLDGLAEHPVVHVSWHDASAFAAALGKRLPTEAEWELAARGGLEQRRLPWGDELVVDGEHRANVWQGRFPDSNTAEDGWVGTAPVRAFRPNGFGLHHMSGNVWEWCRDWFDATHPGTRPLRDPVGPARGSSKVLRGGSYLCHDSYCNRYRVSARTAASPDSSTGNTGFRCARTVDPGPRGR